MKKRSSAILFAIKNHTLLKNVCYKLFGNKDCVINDPAGQNKEANRFMNYKYDCSNPRTFNEYIGWMKFHYFNKTWEKCADKLGGKEFLNELGLGKYVPKTLGIYKSAEEINLDSLPDRFVLKTNHDSGSVFLCDKHTTDFSHVFATLNDSIKRSYSKNGEWVYANIIPCILAEEIVIPIDDSRGIVDYKFFVYNGHFKWGFVVQDRNTDSRFTVFEKDFEHQNVEYIYLRPKKKDAPSKPKHFDEMVRLAELIGKHFWFVRVDFYETVSGPMIGELTFFSHSGLGPFTKKAYDLRYGEFFEETPFFGLAHPSDTKQPY